MPLPPSQFRRTCLIVAVCTVAAVSCSRDPKLSAFNPSKIAIEEVTGSGFKRLLNDSLVFVDSKGVEWVAPKGTWTDGASVPRAVLWVTDGRFSEEFLKAAVVHDAYSQEENETRCPDQYQSRPWRQVHRMFYEAMLADGTPKKRAILMYTVVRLFGPKWNADLGAAAETTARELSFDDLESALDRVVG